MKVTVLQPMRYDPKKKTAQPGEVVEIDDEEAQELAAMGHVELPKKGDKSKE